MRASRVRAWALAGAILAVALGGVTPAAARSVALSAEQSENLVKTMVSLSQNEKLLLSISGMTPEAASKIVAYRKSGKSFSTVAEFRQISGLTDAEFDKLATSFSRGHGAALPEERKESAPPKTDADLLAKTQGTGRTRRNLDQVPKPGAAPSKSGTEAPKLDLDVKSNYYSILPGYDLSKVDEAKRKSFLDTVNREMCSCGCSGETLGYCIVNDPGCPVVKTRVRKIYTDIVGSAPVAPAGSGPAH